MDKIKVLNLYAGIGGNRKLWENVEVTAVEIDPQVAVVYSGFFPDDRVIVADAHQYLLEHYDNGWGFIWSSPPCPTHSKLMDTKEGQGYKRYPDMNLYQEIIWLQHYSKCKFAIENVRSYYEPLIRPQIVDRHYYWANFVIENIELPRDFNYTNAKIVSRLDADEFRRRLKEFLGIDCDNVQYLKNCVHPKVGLQVFNCAFKFKQTTFEGGIL
jgi:DNA (cytosine-5)-methyltransferase 1